LVRQRRQKTQFDTHKPVDGESNAQINSIFAKITAQIDKRQDTQATTLVTALKPDVHGHSFFSRWSALDVRATNLAEHCFVATRIWRGTFKSFAASGCCFDADLAQLRGRETKRFNEQIRRNPRRGSRLISSVQP
jgi:hypothetical protein